MKLCNTCVGKQLLTMKSIQTHRLIHKRATRSIEYENKRITEKNGSNAYRTMAPYTKYHRQKAYSPGTLLVSVYMLRILKIV